MSKQNLNPNVRAITHWHTFLSSIGSKSPLEDQMSDLSKKNNLPQDFMNPKQSMSNMQKRMASKSKEEEEEEQQKQKRQKQEKKDGDEVSAAIRRMLMKAKTIQDLFAPSQQQNVKASDMHEWKQTTQRWEQMMGAEADEGMEIEGFGAGMGAGMGTGEGMGTGGAEGMGMGGEGGAPGGTLGGTAPGSGFTVNKEDIEDVFYLLEAKMVKKMSVMELLKDEELYKTIDPSIHLVEELLYQKHNLTGVTLVHAKALIKKYVDKVAEVLKQKVEKAIRKIPNPDIVPKKIFRDLNLKRTIWKNLPNWDEEEKRLFVDKLIYHRAGKKTIPTKIIIVVDQSGSMVDAMVQTVILASIFSGLPNTDIELFAFDTRVVNLTKYVKDPLEALMQTQLGGGTYINQALLHARKGITDPKNTAMVLITDYYEGGSEEDMFNTIITMKEDGVKIISLASMNRRGYVSVNTRFVNRLKHSDIETIHGNFDQLIDQLKKFL